MRLFSQPLSAGSPANPAKPAAPADAAQPAKPSLLVALFILWLTLNAFFLIHTGIVTTGEADAYTRIAPELLQKGHLPSANLWLYSIPIFLIAFAIKFHLGYSFVIGYQLALNLAATWYFFDTVRRLFAYAPSAEKRAALATTVLLLNIPYQTFNTYLQTESLFHSGSLLLTCYCIRQQKFGGTQLMMALLGTALLCLTRPIGLLYWPALFALYYYTNLRTRPRSVKLIYITTLTIIFILLLNLVIGSGGQYDFLLPFREQHIVCGAPTSISAPTTITAPTTTTIFDLVGYIATHPLTFLRLAALRTLSFWGVYRSWYSAAHNTWLISFFYPIILLAIATIKHFWRIHPAALIYTGIIIMLTWGTVLMTCDDWSNRIFLSITPFIILLASPFRLK